MRHLFSAGRISGTRAFLLASLVVWLAVGPGALAQPPESRATQTPAVVGHRGLLRHAPENTLPAFRACLELRLGFELDVRRTADGVLVCLHDDTVDRTTSGSGPLGRLSLRELKELDAGRWFDAAFAGEKAPTLNEVFALLAQYPAAPCQVTVDMKGSDPRIEEDVVALALQHKVLPRLVFIGRTIDHAEVRERLLQASKDAAVATLANTSDELPAALADSGSRWVYLRFIPTAKQVAEAHALGKKVFVAGPTVAGVETENWQAATQAGVDGILTDYPLELRATLREK